MNENPSAAPVYRYSRLVLARAIAAIQKQRIPAAL